MPTSPSQAFANAYSTTCIGMLFSWMFFGGTVAQIFYYFQNYSKDKLPVKSFVLLLLALDLVKEIALCNAFWSRVVTNRGNILAAEIWTPSDYMVWVFSALAVVCVQWFYIRNIWILSQRAWLRVPLTAIALLLPPLVSFSRTDTSLTTLKEKLIAFVYETNLAQMASTGGNETSIHAHLLVPSRLQSVTDLATNVYISLSLIFILRGAKSGFKTTDNMIGRLITFVVNRGLFIFVLQLLEVVLYNWDGHWLGDTMSNLFYFPSSTININAVLIVLNERRRIRDEDSPDLDSKYSAPLGEFQAAVMDAATSHAKPVDPENVQTRSIGEEATFALSSQTTGGVR
ncbi:uncharacterized protein B0H18DRAFT_1209979 [Fomitopsis serialis]|uniref:uncharacterized protein n=1 Tax=Fomitopsis serialis TaxID=139415 RepID=UPI002008AC1C|nr:uncharacterized protein B0H18DRAFT_1209979 [Neoantrodia serialis]KAH9929243.1 hypothetical protein B0H18DRAFT_1209979 [Neoantrodia serialis]